MMTSNKETKNFGKIVLKVENKKDGKCIYYSYKNKTEGRYFSNDEIAKDIKWVEHPAFERTDLKMRALLEEQQFLEELKQSDRLRVHIYE